MWIDISSQQISVGSASKVLAVNSETAKALWVTRVTEQGFKLELETVISVDNSGNIHRHLALLGLFDSEGSAKQKVLEFLTETGNYFVM